MASALDAAAVTRRVERELRKVARRERATQEKRYLKSETDHLGANASQVHAVVARVLREHPTIARKELATLARALWRTRVFELRAVAALALGKRSDLLTPADLPLVERMIRE